MKALQTKKHMNFTKILFINTMREEGGRLFWPAPFERRMRNGYQNTGNGIARAYHAGAWIFCKAKNVFDEKRAAWLKSVHQQYYAPVVLFNAFLCAEYNAKIVVLFVLIYVGYLLAIGTGLLLNKTGKSCSVFMPFLLASAEGGMLGYALYGLITGTQTGFAAVDLGQTVFAYTAFLALLKMTDGKKVTARNLWAICFPINVSGASLLGIICGATGIGKLVLNSSVGGIVTSVISMIAAPTSAIVLLVVGYELNMKRELMKKVLITVVNVWQSWQYFLVAVSAIVTGIFGYDKELEVALMVLYSLPAPFIIRCLQTSGDDSEYVSTT